MSSIRRATVVSLVAALAGVAGCEPSGQQADVILTGGRIWYGPEAPIAGPEVPTAVAVAEGKVLAVGSDADIEALAGPATERIALEGRRVVPGFVDSHTHFIDGGFELASVQLRDAAMPEEFARRIGEFAAAHPGDWVTGGQWDHELWGGELPRRDWIDPLTPESPVFVTRLDGHMGLANSHALELAGVTAETPDPPGGTIVRDAEGRPTGILKDEAQSLVSEVMPPPSEEALDGALQAAIEHTVARGVTMITNMGTWTHLETFRRAHARDKLAIRVYSVVPIATWERLAEFVSSEGRGDDRLFWGGLKGFVDGSLGSATAWFYEPYEDEPGTTGLIVTDTLDFERWIIAGDSAGLQVIVHAIGDRAIDWLLNAYAEARTANGPRDRRFRIEHTQHVTREGIPRIARDAVVPSMQPYHAIDDGRWAERRIGPERIKTTYAFRSLLDAGAKVAFGSDWTVAPIDPLLGIYAAVTRRTIDGAHPDGWVPEQKIGVAEAVAGYTVDAAYACFMEDVLGELKPGKYADLVVLSDDLFTIDPIQIENVKVDLTMVEGAVVYQRTG
jgi:predicted amidohydrolase YtcJ